MGFVLIGVKGGQPPTNFVSNRAVENWRVSEYPSTAVPWYGDVVVARVEKSLSMSFVDCIPSDICFIRTYIALSE